jgi:hypothetical protein
VVCGEQCIVVCREQCIVVCGETVHCVEYYLLGISPASELSESTFRNLVSVPSS